MRVIRGRSPHCHVVGGPHDGAGMTAVEDADDLARATIEFAKQLVQLVVPDVTANAVGAQTVNGADGLVQAVVFVTIVVEDLGSVSGEEEQCRRVRPRPGDQVLLKLMDDGGARRFLVQEHADVIALDIKPLFQQLLHARCVGDRPRELAPPVSFGVVTDADDESAQGRRRGIANAFLSWSTRSSADTCKTAKQQKRCNDSLTRVLHRRLAHRPPASLRPVQP